MKPIRAAVPAALVALMITAAPLVAQTPPALRTTELGRGPTVVLVPGLGGARMQWLPTARKLMTSHRVVLVDLPGHGDSPMIDPLSVEAAADALDGLLARYPAESTVVVGHGFGGTLAIVGIKRQPARARGVIVIDAGLKSPVNIPDQQKKYFLDYVDQNFDAFTRQMFTQLGRDSAQGVEIHAKASLVPQPVMKSYLRTLLDMDQSMVLRGYPRPLMYLGSSRAWPDSLSWPEIAKQRGYAEAHGIRTGRIGNSGYLVMSDQPDSLAAVIAEFTRQAMTPQ